MIEKQNRSVRLSGQETALGALLARRIPGGLDMADCPTTEQLSELIEGKLAHEDRKKIIAHLGDCAVCFSVVSESMGIREDLAARSRARIKKYLAWLVPAGLAAAAVMLIAFRIVQPATHEVTEKAVPARAPGQAFLAKKSQPRQDAFMVRSFAAELAARLPAGDTAAVLARIAEERPKPQTIYGFSSVVTPEKAAFRIGACLTDLEVARRAKDRELSQVFAGRLAELLRSVEARRGLLPPVTGTGRTSGIPGRETERYESVSRLVEAFFANRKEEVYLRFGSWAEASGLAAEIRATAFFQPAVVRDLSKELEERGVPVGTLKDLSQMEAIISSDRIPPDQFTVLGRLLADIKEMY